MEGQAKAASTMKISFTWHHPSGRSETETIVMMEGDITEFFQPNGTLFLTVRVHGRQTHESLLKRLMRLLPLRLAGLTDQEVRKIEALTDDSR